MKVIMTRDVPKVGKDGEMVVVADGYARNYLFPRQLAVVADRAAVKNHQARIQRETDKSASLLSTAQEQGEKLNGKEFQILARAAARSTRLFGAVTEADVAETIKEALGYDVDKRRVSLINPIKVTGTYELTARLHNDVIVPFKIEVVTQEILDERARAAAAAEARAAKEAAEAQARLDAEAARAAAAASETEAETDPETPAASDDEA